jgi:hypothetical protein
MMALDRAVYYPDLINCHLYCSSVLVFSIALDGSNQPDRVARSGIHSDSLVIME